MSKILGELEEKVMQILWQAKHALKPAEVQAALDTELAYTTVMTVLHRLWQKKLLRRERSKNSYCYLPLVTKDEYVSNNIKNLFSNFLADYGSLAIAQFVDTVNTDPKHREILETYLKNNPEND